MNKDNQTPDRVVEGKPIATDFIQKVLRVWDERKRYYEDAIEVEQRYHHVSIADNLSARKDELDKCSLELQRILNNFYLTTQPPNNE